MKWKKLTMSRSYLWFFFFSGCVAQSCSRFKQRTKEEIIDFLVGWYFVRFSSTSRTRQGNCWLARHV